MTYRNKHRRQSRIAALTAAGLLCGALGYTGVKAGEPPVQHMVSRAQESAQRSAAAESALRPIKERLAGQSREHAEIKAHDIVRAATAFRQLNFPTTPDNWVEAGLDLSKAQREGDRLVQVLPDGGKVTFTIEPEVQEFVTRMLRDNQVPHGGIVLLEPDTGRVIAMAGHSSQGASHAAPEPFTQRAFGPSASVFKVVTAAALIEGAGVDPQEEVCYHGGSSYLTERNIKGDPRLDKRCSNLGGALAWSINSLIAKLAYKELDREDLQQWAERFGYNQEIPFELPVEVSRANIGADPIERARAAAGFWHTHLGPLHGALIGAALGNDGIMMRPTLIEKYESPQGHLLYSFEPREFRKVMEPETARTLRDLMYQTTTNGTARRHFANRGAFPNDVRVTGKTGTLSFQDPFLRFTWFVGHAHNRNWDDHAGIAMGGAVANTANWRLLGPYAVSEAVRKYYEVERGRRKVQEVALRQ